MYFMISVGCGIGLLMFVLYLLINRQYKLRNEKNAMVTTDQGAQIAIAISQLRGVKDRSIIKFKNGTILLVEYVTCTPNMGKLGFRANNNASYMITLDPNNAKLVGCEVFSPRDVKYPEMLAKQATSPLAAPWD